MICEYCKNEFIPKFRFSKSRGRKFCSKKCSAQRPLPNLLDKCIQVGECLEYQGNFYIQHGGKVVQVNRLAFKLIYGREPVGVVNHSCDNSFCFTHLQDSIFRKHARFQVVW